MKARTSASLLALAAVSALPLARSDSNPGPATRCVSSRQPPGGSVDLLARVLAEDFSRSFACPSWWRAGRGERQYRRRPGYKGARGRTHAVRRAARPVCHQRAAHVLHAFNPAADIAPVAMLGVAPLLLVVHPSVPRRICRAARLDARRRRACALCLAGGRLERAPRDGIVKSLAGVDAVHVPYKGSAAQATTDLLAGRVAMSFVNTSTTSSTFATAGCARSPWRS